MGKDYENTRLSNDFVNLTDETIFIYDDANGNICSFPPQPPEIPDLSAQDSSIYRIRSIPVHYIVKREIASTLKAFRPLDDIVVVSGKYHGRQNALISYLVWGEDFRTKVRLFSGADKVSFNHK